MPQPPEHVAKAVQERRELRQLYAIVFGSEEGQKVMAHLQAQTHFLMPSHTPGDPYETAFRDGERNVMLGIIAMIQPFDEQVETKRIEDQELKDPLEPFSRPKE